MTGPGETLGRGAMGVVRAVVGADGAALAEKRPASADARARDRFAREVEALRRVGEHPNVAGFRGAGVDDGGPWLRMARVDGRPLRAWTGRPLPPAQVLSVLRGLAEALAAAHARGVAHRDVKPDNVLVAPDGRAVLVDFGAASLSGPTPPAREASPGTRAYAPPEADGDGVAADRFALGLVVTELLTGSPSDPLPEGPADPALARAAGWARALTDRDPARRPAPAEVARALADVPQVPLPWDDTLATGPDDPPPGPARVGRYELLAVLGRGGMGVVHLARDPALDRMVAVKRLRRADPAAVERLQREARAAARLDHPGIVPVLDFGVDEAGPFLVMAHVDGPTLAERLAARGPPDPETARRWVRAIGGALAAAHAAGLVHRDVKPGNVLLDGDAPRLTDFGLVTGAAASPPAAEEAPVGTPAWMAPEQARGGAVDARADVWALGAVAAALFGPDPPPEVARACRRALAEDPAARTPTVQAFLDDLAPPPARSRRLAAGGLGLALAAALLAAGLAGRALAERRAADAREGAAADRWAQLRRDAAARPEESEAAFRAFVALPDHAGTAALVDAWLERAEGLARAGDAAGALAARASGYLAAATPDREREALAALGGQLAAERRWGALRVVLDALGPDAPEDLRRAGDVADRRLEGPSARSGAVGPLLGALSRATRLPFPGDPIPADLDGDGLPEAVVPVGEGAWARVPGGEWDRTPPALLVTGAPSLVPLGVADGRPLVLAVARVGDDAHHRLLALGEDPARPAELAAFDRSLAMSIAAADLDPADARGLDRVYVGAGPHDRDLVELRAGPPGAPWTVRDGHPATSAANADLEALAVVDLDGDGRRGLLAHAIGFGARDLRLFDVGPDGALALRLRRAFRGCAVAPVRRPAGPALAALGSPVEPPAPGPLHLTVLDAGLAVVAAQPFAGACERLYAGDLDGDGLDDLATAGGTFARGLPGAPAFAEATLDGVRVLALADVDGDGDAEAVVRLDGDPHAWLLGRGDTPVPALTRGAPGVSAAPPELPADLHAAWRRAEVLARTGLTDAARAAFSDLAALAAGDGRARAHLRVGELAADPEAAAAAFARAAEVGSGALAARAAGLAADAFARAHRYADAAAWSARAGRPALAERQRAWAAPLRDVPVGEAPWRLDDPAVAPTGPGLALRTDAGPLLALGVVPADDHVAIELDLRVDRLEWGAGLVVTLGAGEASATLAVSSSGGDGRQWLRAEAYAPSGAVYAASPDPADVWATRLTLRFDLVASEGRMLLATAGGVALASETADTLPRGGPWTLAIGGRSAGCFLEAEVVGLRVVGAALARPEGGAPAAPSPARALRSAGPVARAALRAAAGDAWFGQVLEAWGSMLRQHPDDPRSAEVLDELGPFPAPAGRAPAVREAIAELAALRAAAHRRAGRPAAAIADARVAVAAAGDAAPSGPLPLPPASAAWLELARAESGTAPEAALASVGRALAASPAPEALADGVARDPALAPLRSLPGWAAVDAARRSPYPAEP